MTKIENVRKSQQHDNDNDDGDGDGDEDLREIPEKAPAKAPPTT